MCLTSGKLWNAVGETWLSWTTNVQWEVSISAIADNLEWHLVFSTISTFYNTDNPETVLARMQLQTNKT